jgi:hypothetical protein
LNKKKEKKKAYKEKRIFLRLIAPSLPITGFAGGYALYKNKPSIFNMQTTELCKIQ